MVDKSTNFNWLVRVGYFSRAILYSVLGIIALNSAGQISDGTIGVFQAVESFPAGAAILWLMVLGLIAYALFRFASTFFDIENNGSDGRGWARRIGHAGSAIGHLALAWSAYQLAKSSGHSDRGAEDIAAGILSIAFGEILVSALGFAFGIAALFQIRKCFSGEFMHRISGAAPDATRILGGAGFCARGVVYGVIAWSLVKAGFASGGSDQVKTLGGAVASLAGEGFVFTSVAVGLLMFGLFSLVLARYRIIPDMSPDGRVPEFRR